MTAITIAADVTAVHDTIARLAGIEPGTAVMR